MDKGLNSLIYLIELVNFNKSVPKNHSYCVTAINDKHVSVIDEKTNTIIKTNKADLFDKVLVANLDNLEKITNNSHFSSKQRQEYKNKINYLRTSIFENIKFMKRYQNDINLISYNNKELIKETWKNLKCIEDEENEYYGDTPKGFNDLIKEIHENQKPSFFKSSLGNFNTYFRKSASGNNVFIKNKTGNKGELYGIYSNGKVKKITSKEIDI